MIWPKYTFLENQWEDLVETGQGGFQELDRNRKQGAGLSSAICLL